MKGQRITGAVAARVASIAALAVVIGLAAYSAALAQAAVSGLKPLSPQPEPKLIAPKLSVTYYDVKVRWIDELVRFANVREGHPGEPLPMLNYNTGAGNVLTTDRKMLVGAYIDGLMKFDVPGTYQLAAVSNDGIRLYVDGELIIDEPGVRGTEFTDTTMVTIEEPGWYGLHIKYFQRKGTAALELYWKRPDKDGDLEIVPAEAYAHILE